MARWSLALLMLAGLVSVSFAADPFPANPLPGDRTIQSWLDAEVKRLETGFQERTKSKETWEGKRAETRQQFLDMLGLWPLPEKTPLKATVTGTIDHAGVTIEKLHYQSRPGLYVTANLYRPTKATGKKLPAILYVCGHSNRGRDGNKTAFQDHGLWFANHGYVCLIVDTLQLGEVAGKHHGTYNLDRFWWQSRGYTSAGVECWNGIRGIDYLVSRPDVDAAKIGVTGISGGGATTVWVAAADERVRVAVPVSGMSDLESYVSHRVINGHCDCMFAINYPRWEWTTILALHAPKPLLFANSDNDAIFPMDGNRRIVARLRGLYEMLGSKDLVDEHVSPGGHDYRPDLRLAIFRFFQKHLNQDTSPIADDRYPAIDGKALRVFTTDADLPRDAINDRADEVFVPKATVTLPKAEDYATWRTGMLTKLKERSFRGLPSRPELAVKLPARTIILTEGNDTAWAEAVPLRGEPVVMPVRGTGDDRWTRKNPPNTVERSLALLGLTADTLRVADVIKMKGPTPVRLVGKGRTGIIAAYAALLEPGLADEVIIIDPPVSHRDGPHFLGVMQVLDIPEALGLLAPTVTLTLQGATDPAFDRTATLFRLAGREKALIRK